MTQLENNVALCVLLLKLKDRIFVLICSLVVGRMCETFPRQMCGLEWRKNPPPQSCYVFFHLQTVPWPVSSTSSQVSSFLDCIFFKATAEAGITGQRRQLHVFFFFVVHLHICLMILSTKANLKGHQIFTYFEAPFYWEVSNLNVTTFFISLDYFITK